MLKLINIKKTYLVADQKVEALKGINLAFRKNEFVSILGPSGCGKTTTLNIIGGLDKYTSGDLVINGKSTKQFCDRDWDVYRNHRIGFIFQSYNLIPHQNVLSNVELSLTIAGLPKEERIKKAKKALDRVGLSDQYYKKPNQLSGGQCQRVAIARALVNEPEILLADEPTGALDTVTSVQIMDLIKDISKEKLVIMVTHNPELAEKYSSRIINLLDGEVINDSNPYSFEEENNEYLNDKKQTKAEIKKVEKAKMSWWTSFKLSAKNLLSKKRRTILTCFAGSIGIIGISMVLAVSSGIKGYIADMQDDMLSGNPITITEETIDMNAMLGQMSSIEQLEILENQVNVDSILSYMADKIVGDNSFIVKNTISQEYINYLNDMPSEYVHAISYNYGINLNHNIYTEYKYNSTSEGEMVSLTALLQMYSSTLNDTDFAKYTSFLQMLATTMSQSIPNEEYIKTQYDLVAGSKIATKKNEIMLVLNDSQSAVDITLAQLGFFTQEEFVDLAINFNNEDVNLKQRFTYDEILNKKFMYYPNNTIYSTTTNPMLASMFPFTYSPYATNFDKSEGIELEIVGILKVKEAVSYGALTSGFYYTEDLAKYALETAKDSEIVKFANGNEDFVFGTTSTTTGMISNGIMYTYHYTDVSGNLHPETEINPSTFMPVNMTLLTQSMSSSSLLTMGMSSSSTDTTNIGPTLRDLGGLALPNLVKIYPLSFEEKFLVTDYLDAWNDTSVDITLSDGTQYLKDNPCRLKVTYNDTMEIIIALINTMINIVTYALIAFTCLALLVSCVMIAIITYVSVIERIKEIGVIRSLGGRKKDVSHLFNAETFMIGAFSGFFGIGVTYLISFIANQIIGSLTGVYTICSLPLDEAATMILLSIFLTVISGLIPSRSAAKKDPVTALRTE